MGEGRDMKKFLVLLELPATMMPALLLLSAVVYASWAAGVGG